MRDFNNKKVAVLGFGLEGKDLAKFLLKKGAEITVFDRKSENELDFSDVDKKRIKFISGGGYLERGLDGFDIVFRSPGVYRYLPEIIRAEKRGVVISSPIKLFFDLCPGKVIGVTGTKGKGTTSTLIYQILKKAGKDAYLAGNIGIPVLEILPKLTSRSWTVLELSSFQLIDMKKSPNVGVVLNITTDHLDWHKDRREYVEAKTQIARHQKNNDFSVLNYDYKDSKSFERLTKSKVCYFSRLKRVEGCYVKNGEIILQVGSRMYDVGNTKKLLLRGEHNWENVCAAVCASFLAGADIDSIRKVVFSFEGLEYRLELVGKIKGVSFYNDSFSTNPQTTLAAINSFDEPITLILGGSDKGLSYDDLGKEIFRKKNVNSIILIGHIGDKIGESLKKAKFKGKIMNLGKASMSEIVKGCIDLTPRGGVVLLSPATASFDMFKDYKDRGRQFKEAVKKFSTNSLQK